MNEKRVVVKTHFYSCSFDFAPVLFEMPYFILVVLPGWQHKFVSFYCYFIKKCFILLPDITALQYTPITVLCFLCSFGCFPLGSLPSTAVTLQSVDSLCWLSNVKCNRRCYCWHVELLFILYVLVYNETKIWY